ncbi:MAG: hypothetical protein JWO42_3486 [Chloroflexi bacterium]|nr:hypothetical protein [Chloroflexota bacterium]
MPERRTPLYDYHLRSARELVKGGGDYMFPISFTSPVEEHLNVRKNVGMQDLSSMGEVDIKGPGAERLIRRLLVNDISDLEPGQVRYSTMCNEAGGIVDDITVYKFNEEHFMIVTSSGPRQKTFRWVRDHAAGMGAYVTDVTASIALLAVQGPRSRGYLRTVVKDADVDSLKFFRFTPARIGDVDLLVSRSGYTGELGYELYAPAEQALVLWDLILQTSKEYRLQPYGVAAMQSLRIEKSLPLYGADLSEEYTPFHAGLDRWIAFNKHDFIGREALLKVQEQGLQRRWVGLILQSEIPAAVNDKLYSISDVATFKEKMFSGAEAGEFKDPVLPSELQVGHVTCSTRGHSVGEMLAMAYVDTAHSWPGHNLIVEINGRPVQARVASTPFFDPGNARIRAKARDDEPRPESAGAADRASAPKAKK